MSGGRLMWTYAPQHEYTRQVKRTALARRTPLKTSTTLRRQRQTAELKQHRTPPSKRKSRYRQRERFIDHMLWVKTLPCAARHLGPCAGVIEADHDSRGRGMGQKSHDSTVIPLCTQHHAHRQQYTGVFSLPGDTHGMARERVRAFVDAAHAEVVVLCARMGRAMPSPDGTPSTP